MCRALALKTQDPKACQYLLEIYESDNPEEQLEAFKVFRNRLVLKVAKEFMEVNKIGDVRSIVCIDRPKSRYPTYSVKESHKQNPPFGGFLYLVVALFEEVAPLTHFVSQSRQLASA
jgi:hypothetical protein